MRRFLKAPLLKGYLNGNQMPLGIYALLVILYNALLGMFIFSSTRSTRKSQAVGEVLTCSYCMDMWAGLASIAALRKFPTQSRLVMSLLASVAGADFLHVLYESIRTQENLLTIEEERREKKKSA